MGRSVSKIIVVFIVASIGILSMDAISYSKEIIIKAGTPIPVRLDQSVSSETATTGETVRFKVVEDVLVDDIVVIKAGTEVTGEVSHAEKTGSLGAEGKLGLVIRWTKAVDNTRVPLRASLSKAGDEKVAEAIIFCPFIKGEATQMGSGQEFKAYVDYDTKISIAESQ